MTIGDVAIGPLEDVSTAASFGSGEIEDAQSVASWFWEMHGAPNGGTRPVRVVKPAFGVRIPFPPRDLRVYRATVARLQLASFAFGAAVLTSNHGTPAEAVQPYMVNIHESAPRRFRFLLPTGGVSITSHDAMMIVRPTWLVPPTGPYDTDLLEVLGHLVATALKRPTSRAAKTLSALQWFIQASSFTINLNVSDQQNLVALTTAFEMLLDLPDPPPKGSSKKEEFAKRIGRLTTGDLAGIARSLYTERSEVVHAGRSNHPSLEGGHISYLDFGRSLFEACLNESLTRTHHRTWPTSALMRPSRSQTVLWLERRARPNRERLLRLANLSADRTAKLPDRQTEFLELLAGISANPNDFYYDEPLLRRAVANVCKTLKHALYLRSHDKPNGQHAAAMRRLGDQLFQIGSQPHVRGYDIVGLLDDLGDLDEYGIPRSQDQDSVQARYAPIIGNHTLFELLACSDWLGGLAARLDNV